MAVLSAGVFLGGPARPALPSRLHGAGLDRRRHRHGRRADQRASAPFRARGRLQPGAGRPAQPASANFPVELAEVFRNSSFRWPFHHLPDLLRLRRRRRGSDAATPTPTSGSCSASSCCRSASSPRRPASRRRVRGRDAVAAPREAHHGDARAGADRGRAGLARSFSCWQGSFPPSAAIPTLGSGGDPGVDRRGMAMIALPVDDGRRRRRARAPVLRPPRGALLRRDHHLGEGLQRHRRLDRRG